MTSYVQLSYSCKVVNKRLNNKERTYMLDIFQQSLFCISLMVLLMSYPMIYLLIMKVNQNRRRELSSKNWSFKQFLTRWSHLKIRSLFNLNNIHSSGYFQNFLSNIELPNKFPSIVTWHQAAGGQQGQPMGGHSLYPDLGFPHLEGTGPCSPGLMAWPAKPPPTSRELAPALQN